MTLFNYTRVLDSSNVERTRHTAILRKVVIQKCKGICNKLPNGTSSEGSLLQADPSSQCFRATEGKMMNTSIHSWFLLPRLL